MRDNADGTYSIYTSSTGVGGDRELYTEIPFTAIHGMQTRAHHHEDECAIFDTLSETLSDACDGREQGRIAPSKEPSKEPRSRRRVTLQFCIATVSAATLQFLVGYNIAILNTPEKYVFPGHKTGAWSFAVAALSLGAPIGAIFGGRLSAGKGRRFTLFWNSVIFLGGEILQAFAPSLLVLTVARFIIGIASGIATVLVPIYLGELAPPHLRGTLGTINQFAFVTGILAADLLSFRYATEHGWRHLFLMPVFVSVIQLAMMPFVVESPVWLIQQDPEDTTLARQALQNLRGPDTIDDTIDREFSIYVRAAKRYGGGEQETQRDIMMEMMVSRPMERYMFFCIFALHTAQQMCGISAVFYYSTSLFENIVDDPLVGTTLIGTVNVIFTYVALLLMDSCRRKSLILWSIGVSDDVVLLGTPRVKSYNPTQSDSCCCSSLLLYWCYFYQGMFLACSTLVLAQMGIFGTGVALVAVNFYVAFYEIGMGPIPWLVIAEMFEAKYVTVIMSIISQWSWFVNFFVGLVFPTMHKLLGEYTFVPFALGLIVSFFFTWIALPETHGKTPAQVVADVEETKKSRSDEDKEAASGGTFHQCYVNCNSINLAT